MCGIFKPRWCRNVILVFANYSSKHRWPHIQTSDYLSKYLDLLNSLCASFCVNATNVQFYNDSQKRPGGDDKKSTLSIERNNYIKLSTITWKTEPLFCEI